MKKIKLVLVLFLCLFVFSSCTNPGLKDAKTLFSDNEDYFTIVADYLSSYDYDNIGIWEADGTMSLLLSEHVTIDDDEVNQAIKKLFHEGCYVITKSDENNCISFSFWSRFRDYGAGILYSIDGINVPTEYYLTKRESIGVDRWYYYEADYNLWRTSND